MENYFILLELPFDLPESDTNKISEAISKKQAQWSRDQSNPVKKAKASEYLAALEDIKKVMLDPTARKQEAAKAKQIKASKAKELEAKLSLYRAKGDELSEKDLKRLVKVFGAFGFTADEIKKKFGSGNKKQDKIDPSEVLDKTQARNVQNFMQQLDMKEKTLYDFLSLAPTASWNQLCEAADSMKKKILAKGDKTGRDNAVQSLCGLCVVIFKDVASKKKYDNYVNLTKYRAVNEAVDELALSNQKRIEPKMKESLIDIAVRQYHVSVSDASVYINHYCEYMGYALPENKIVCGLCGTENPAGTTNCVKCGKPLIIPCPACSAENNNSAKVCAKCGFDLTKMDKAVELLRQAKQKYSEKALEEAERLVKEAKAYWPNHADVLGLEKTIQDERKQAADTIAAIMKDIQDKKMYAAQTKIDQAKANGFSIDPSVASKVTAVLKEVESQLAIMRNASGDEAFTIAMKLTELIADSDELNQSLKKFPPDEVPALSSKRVGDEITLTWKPSPSIGEISYIVVRKENTYPNGPTDGATVYSGKELAYTDSNAPKNGFIFIIDPLTLNQFAMDVEDKVDLNAYGASSKDFEDILNIMLINLEKMFGLKDKDTLKRNLAVVINKVDIPTLEEKIGEIAAQQYLAENAETCKSYMDARDAVCRNFLEEYGAGNFVRTAEAKFKTVRYFTCSALGHNHEGQPYEGKNVVDPVMWLLQQADSSIKAE